jgi:hypothetical protein
VRRLADLPSGEPIVVSATLLTTYRRCPQQALGRLRGAFAPPTRGMFKGALAHRIFARHLENGPIEADDFALVCRQETGRNLNGQLAATGLKPSEFGSVVDEVSSLYDRFRQLPVDGFRSAEVAFDLTVSDDLSLRGRIDAVFDRDGDETIVDWKTGSELGPDVDAQLTFYAFVWGREHGSPPSEMVALSLATGERVSRRPTQTDLDDIEAEVAAMVEELRGALADDADVDRTAGPHCRWCALLATCSEGESALSLLGRQTPSGGPFD